MWWLYAYDKYNTQLFNIRRIKTLLWNCCVKTQSSERPMEKEKEKTEPMIEESSRTGENEPSIQFSDDTEKPAQVDGKSQSVCLTITLSPVQPNKPPRVTHCCTNHLGVKHLWYEFVRNSSLALLQHIKETATFQVYYYALIAQRKMYFSIIISYFLMKLHIASASTLKHALPSHCCQGNCLIYDHFLLSCVCLCVCKYNYQVIDRSGTDILNIFIYHPAVCIYHLFL